jgi:hypothetical protein
MATGSIACAVAAGNRPLQSASKGCGGLEARTAERGGKALARQSRRRNPGPISRGGRKIGRIARRKTCINGLVTQRLCEASIGRNFECGPVEGLK